MSTSDICTEISDYYICTRNSLQYFLKTSEANISEVQVDFNEMYPIVSIIHELVHVSF